MCFQLVAFVIEHIWHKALVFAVWMVFSWLWVYMDVTILNFLEYIYLSLLKPSFAFDIGYVVCVCVCVCVCVLEWFRISLTIIFLCVYMNMRLEIFVWVCVCVCGSVVWNILVIIFLLIICVCVCIYIRLWMLISIYVVYDSSFIKLWFKFIYEFLCFYLK